MSMTYLMAYHQILNYLLTTHLFPVTRDIIAPASETNSDLHPLLVAQIFFGS